MKVLHGAWSCSLEQITKGTINIFATTYLRVLQIDIGFKHDVLVCFKGIAQTFENPQHAKPPNEGITCCGYLKVFSLMRVLQIQCICLKNMEL